MEYEALLSEVDHSAVIQLLKLLRQLCFLGQSCKRGKNAVIYILCGIIVGQSPRHGKAVFRDAESAAFSLHDLRELHAALCLR